MARGRGRAGWALLLVVLCGTLRVSAHPAEPRDYVFAGSPIALGAATVFRGPAPIALFEFYAQPAGVVSEQAPRGSAPEPIAEPWIAAMYYPYVGDAYRTRFVTRPIESVALSANTGGVVTFSFPGVGSVRLELKGSTATPRTFPQGLTTPGGHHDHSWNILAVLAQGKAAYVSGSITRGGQRDELRTLFINGPTSWIALGAVGTIATD